jgi:hypothetical protein
VAVSFFFFFRFFFSFFFLKGVSAAAYHGGLAHEERHRVHMCFLKDETQANKGAHASTAHTHLLFWGASAFAELHSPRSSRCIRLAALAALFLFI